MKVTLAFFLGRGVVAVPPPLLGSGASYQTRISLSAALGTPRAVLPPLEVELMVVAAPPQPTGPPGPQPPLEAELMALAVDWWRWHSGGLCFRRPPPIGPRQLDLGSEKYGREPLGDDSEVSAVFMMCVFLGSVAVCAVWLPRAAGPGGGGTILFWNISGGGGGRWFSALHVMVGCSLIVARYMPPEDEP